MSEGDDDVSNFPSANRYLMTRFSPSPLPANGQQELSTSSAQQGLALAELTGDVCALLQLWLLMAAIEGRSLGGTFTPIDRLRALHCTHLLLQHRLGMQSMSRPV